MELTAIFRDLAQAAAPTAITALWQGALLAAALWAFLRMVPGMAAADRFRMWAAGFAVLIAIPFMPLLHAIRFGATLTESPVAPHASPAWFDLDLRWGLAIAALWIATSAWRAVDLSAHALRLWKVWKRAELVERTAAGLEVCATSELDRPSVIGFLRPRILIPAWLLEKLSPSEIEQVVLHEAEHLRRRDDWTNLLQKLALVVFPLNPALAWMERRLCQERELACDDAVVCATGKPRAYAACLASLAERGLNQKKAIRREALSLGAWRRRPELARRVHRLLKSMPQLSSAAARALLATVGCGLLFGSVEFARAPQLVAFVAPVIAQSNAPDVVNAGLRSGRGAIKGYRAVNAVAQMPTRSQIVARQTSDARVQGMVSATADKRTSEKRVAGAVKNVAGEGYARQWIVLTEWEPAGRAERSGNIAADYDIGPTGNARPDGAEFSAGTTAAVEQWTIVQLVLHVETESEGASKSPNGSAKGSTPRPAPSAALPLQDGWLVLQL